MVELFSEILGKTVVVPDRPKRIVSFSPAVTETLFGLGLEDSIVGVSAFCAKPPAAKLKRHVGSYNTVSYELLDDLKPDLIFTVMGYQRDFALRLSQRYPVYPVELPVSVAGIVDMVVKVGLVAAAPEKARELSRALLGHLASIGRRKGLTAYVEIDLGGPVSFGAHSYITDAINLLGSASLFEKERVEWLTPDLGKVRAADPDVIIYEPKMFSKFESSDLEELIGSRSWRDMRAVRAGNLFVTPGPLDFIAHHGPSFITDAVPWLGDKLDEAAARV
ncbi:MAG: helical backbone metal receptor [Nitrososphaerales archaeon]|nr:helical backbone metal receptor [Nitrososphaerales archaeon]